MVPFVSVERSMLRWRRTVTPQVPTTLPQLSDILNGGQHEHLLDYAGGKMHVMNVEATDGSMALVMFDPAFINSLPNIEELCVDGTFKVCPRKPSGIYQLTTIMVRVFDNVSSYIYRSINLLDMVLYLSVKAPLKIIINFR